MWNLSKGGRKCESNSVICFVLYCCLKCDSCGYVREKQKDRRGGKRGHVPCVWSSASPTHLQWEAHLGFPERLVAVKACRSCCSHSDKEAVWIIPWTPAEPLVSLVKFIQRLKASPARWLQEMYCLFERWAIRAMASQREAMYRQHRSDTSTPRTCCTNRSPR